MQSIHLLYNISTHMVSPLYSPRLYRSFSSNTFRQLYCTSFFTRLFTLHTRICRSLQLLHPLNLLCCPSFPRLVFLILQFHTYLVRSGSEEGTSRERFFSGDAGFGFSTMAQAVELFSCKVVGGGWRESFVGQEVLLALDNSVVLSAMNVWRSYGNAARTLHH